MKAISYNNGYKSDYYVNSLRSRFSGDADALATELFFAFFFGAYTFYLWDLGAGMLSGVTGIISFLCITRILLITWEWLFELSGFHTKH